MLAVALMTLLVAEFTTSAALGYRSAANQADELRAYYLARSGIQVGLAVIEQSSLSAAAQSESQSSQNNSNATQNNGNTTQSGASGVGPHDSLDQAWAEPTPPIPVDGGLVSTWIVDEDRKINVNNYISSKTHQPDPNFAPVLVRLLGNINVSPDLLPILQDWLDPDSIEAQGGAEADYYLALSPPYEPRNGSMPTIYDLRMLKGMDDVTFFKLSQYLTAVGKPQVNVNTASPEVLAALTPQLENDPSVVQQIVQTRPFSSITDLKNDVPDLPQDPHLLTMLTTESSCFTITGEGDFAGTRKRIYATFARGAVTAPTPGSNQPPGVSFSLMSWHED
jgi:type II secretory pathway component PulK